MTNNAEKIGLTRFKEGLAYEFYTKREKKKERSYTNNKRHA